MIIVYRDRKQLIKEGGDGSFRLVNVIQVNVSFEHFVRESV